MQIKEIKLEYDKGLFGRKSKSPAYIINFFLEKTLPIQDVMSQWTDDSDIMFDPGAFLKDILPLLRAMEDKP